MLASDEMNGKHSFPEADVIVVDCSDLLLSVPSVHTVSKSTTDDAARRHSIGMDSRDGHYDSIVDNASDSSVTARYKALQDSLYKAFAAPDACGLIAIRNVPEFASAKQALLSQAHELAHLPPNELQALEDPDSLYNAGWSYGKEKLGDKVDMNKSSFYYHPLTDVPGTEEDRKAFPLAYPSNKWPLSIPHFEVNAKRLGEILYQVTVQVSRHLDHLDTGSQPDISCDAQQTGTSETLTSENGSQQHASTEEDKDQSPNSIETAQTRVSLYNLLKVTDKVKARLLYYYPTGQNANSTSSIDKEQSTDSGNDTLKLDSWIGWHNDSGFLTALAGDLYVNHQTGEILPHDAIDQSTFGLHIYNRQGQVQHVSIPADCCAVQIGEATQIITGGLVAATPHCVRAPPLPLVARVSLACFVDSRPDTPLSVPSRYTREDVIKSSVTQEGIPPLEQRWISDKMTFGDFLTRTFTLYYEHNDASGSRSSSICEGEEGKRNL
jgi:isopenicillin N synthase-like dioxygenase